MPNHERPVRRTTLFFASRIDAPLVCSGPLTFDVLVGVPPSLAPPLDDEDEGPLLEPLDPELLPLLDPLLLPEPLPLPPLLDPLEPLDPPEPPALTCEPLDEPLLPLDDDAEPELESPVTASPDVPLHARNTTEAAAMKRAWGRRGVQGIGTSRVRPARAPKRLNHFNSATHCPATQSSGAQHSLEFAQAPHAPPTHAWFPQSWQLVHRDEVVAGHDAPAWSTPTS